MPGQGREVGSDVGGEEGGPGRWSAAANEDHLHTEECFWRTLHAIEATAGLPALRNRQRHALARLLAAFYECDMESLDLVLTEVAGRVPTTANATFTAIRQVCGLSKAEAWRLANGRGGGW